MNVDININADCAICRQKRPVISITFHDFDHTMELELDCGHPKSYNLVESDLSALYEHMKNMEEHHPGIYAKKR